MKDMRVQNTLISWLSIGLEKLMVNLRYQILKLGLYCPQYEKLNLGSLYLKSFPGRFIF